MNLVEYPDRDLLVFGAADAIAASLRAALKRQDHVSFSVPGGTTPAPVFDMLSGLPLGWDRITVIPNDERWVPETSDRSNTQLIREHLMVGKAAVAEFVSLYADLPEPELALEQITATLSRHLPLSVVLLGMGEDMHTASLFPGGDRLAEALSPEAPIIMPMRAPDAAETRVTLTARVLADAMSIHVLITGEAKRAAIMRAQTLSPELAPIRSVLSDATVHWAP